MNKNDKKLFFTKNLLAWNSHFNCRMMPWKGESNPYKIWLSEIILQQTRVDQGMGYYNRFIKQYPTIQSLATACDTEVFKLWEGLGYYSRCKNLLSSARFISYELGGKFPQTYQEIITLKGVGPYTAAAIASFAYNLPHAVVDGNVSRVLSRFFGIKTPIDNKKGEKIISTLADELLCKKMPSVYNQSIMDFGATICKPQNPLCIQCPLQSGCMAFLAKMVEALPVKEKSIVKRHRWFYYVIAENKGKVFIKKRLQKDIWQHLHEFILIEKKKKYTPEHVIKTHALQLFNDKKMEITRISRQYTQQLTHQTINGYFIHVQMKNEPKLEDFDAVDKLDIQKLAFPKFITNYFHQSPVFSKQDG